MQQQAERTTDELRRELVERRRAMVALSKELHRLADARTSAQPAQRERLLDDMDRVAAAHLEATVAIDELSDALIRQDRIRAANRAARPRLFRRTSAH